MDALDQLAGPAAGLLNQVDDLLARAGAPAHHPIWPLLRRLRTLPGEAVGAVAALQRAPLAAAGPSLGALAREYEDARADLADGGSWEGVGAEAFAAHRASLAAYLADGPESMTGRLAATASYADALAEWVTHTRAALAESLADVLGSVEAVAVVTGAGSDPQPTAAQAAAEIGARVLGTVAEAYDEAETLLHRWAPRLAELPYRGPADGASTLDIATRIGF